MNETSIDKLVLDILVKNENAARRLNATTKALEKFYAQVEKFDKNNKVLDKLNNISPTSTRGGSTSKGGSKRKDNVNIFATLGKWNYMINMARYYGRSLANIVQLSMDYVETQNLWQVANRNNLEMAEQFIQKMNKAYGVSEATLMNYQAIFKNMLSALGDLSDEVSSGLSMQLTQMALDFSSLYNVTIPSAMQKFQAVLSGQVRPIRSISGYDITENTIFDLYAGAGGEKTMRQLSQIEKRLLRIVAVFDQMSATGATGDMAKTIESASNQARIMSEQFKETMTWTGQTILMWMDSVGVFKYINALLITMKNIMKAIAIDLGYENKNFLDDMVFSAEEASEAVDEIQGKLLSFDKFEALNSKDSNILGIDQTVLDLLEKVKYETQDFQMEAQKLAETWTSWWVDADLGGLTKQAKDLFENLKDILGVVVALIGYNLISKIGKLTLGLSGIATAFGKIGAAVGIYMSYDLIKNWDSLSNNAKALQMAIIGLTAAIWAMTVAQMSFASAATLGVAVATIVGAIGLGVSFVNSLKKNSMAEVPAYATGGFPEDGLFFANSGEMVGQFSNGRTAVANNDQIVTGITQGVYSAMMAYNAQTRGQGGSGDVYLDGTKVGRVVAKGSHSEMVRVGLIKANS